MPSRCTDTEMEVYASLTTERAFNKRDIHALVNVKSTEKSNCCAGELFKLHVQQSNDKMNMTSTLQYSGLSAYNCAKPTTTTNNTVKPALSDHSKICKTKILMTNGSSMQVESIAECSKGSILQYF